MAFSKAAIFIETRKGGQYLNAIKQHMGHLPEWHLCICTTKSSYDEFYAEVIENTPKSFQFIDDIKDRFDYNLLLTSTLFWSRFLDHEKVLIFQHDSGLLRNNINDYLEFDYVGAPWKFQRHGGNGGLSLRTPSVMLRICKNLKWNPKLFNEDIYFSNYMFYNRFGKLAPREICKSFSIEAIYRKGTTGYHAIDKFHSPLVVSNILAQEEKENKWV